MRKSVGNRSKVASGVAAIASLIVVSAASCLLPDRSPDSRVAASGVGGTHDGGAGADTSVGGADAAGGTAGKDASAGYAGIGGAAAQGGSSGTSGSGGIAESGVGGTVVAGSGGSTKGGAAGNAGAIGGQAGQGGTPDPPPTCYEPGTQTSKTKWACRDNPADGGCCNDASTCLLGGSGFCCYTGHPSCESDEECCTSHCGKSGASLNQCCDPPHLDAAVSCSEAGQCCNNNCQPVPAGGSNYCCIPTGGTCTKTELCCSGQPCGSGSTCP